LAFTFGVTKVGVQIAVKSCVCFSSSHSFSPATRWLVVSNSEAESDGPSER